MSARHGTTVGRVTAGRAAEPAPGGGGGSADQPPPTAAPSATAPGGAPGTDATTAAGDPPRTDATTADAPTAGPPTADAPTGTTVAATTEAPDAAAPGDGVAVPAVLALVLVAALAGAALVALVQRLWEGPSPDGDAGASGGGTGPAGGRADRAGGPAGGAEPLAQAAIDVRDRVRSPALAERLAAGLAATGWTTLDPRGDRFDPAHHVAVDREPTGEPGLGGVIAAVERVGYRAPDGAVVRQPEVVVYAYHAAGGAS